MTFSLNESEAAQAEAFSKAHYEHGGRFGASPDAAVSFVFWFTSIGRGCTVKCRCGAEENITDYSQW